MNYSKTINFISKQELKHDIENLNKTQLFEIFKIIQEHTNKYTENTNGIFINLKDLNSNLLLKLKKFVNFCKQNKTDETKLKSILSSIQKKKENLNKEFTNYSLQNLKNSKNYIYTTEKEPEKKLSNSHFVNVHKFPKLNNKKPKFSGSVGKLLKRCKEIPSVNIL